MGVVEEGTGEECPWKMEALQRRHRAVGVLERAQSALFSRVWTSECLGHHCLGSCLKCTFLNKQTKMLMVLPIESDSWWEQSPESVLRGSTWVWLMKCELVGGDTGRCNSATIEGGPDAGLGPGRKKQSLKGHGVHGLYDYLEGGLWPEAPESGLSSH